MAEAEEIIAEMAAEGAQLREKGQEITRVLGSLTGYIDGACQRLRRSRADLGLLIEVDPGYRSADVITVGR